MKKATAKTKAVNLRTLGRATQKGARLRLQEKFDSIVERRRAGGASIVWPSSPFGAGRQTKAEVRAHAEGTGS